MPELVFNALSGPEMKAAILDEIGKALDNTGEFGAHITFPWIKYNYSVGLVCYPKQDKESTDPLVKTSGEKELGSESFAPQAGVRKHTVQDVIVIDVPDLARLTSNQPLPTVSLGPGNVLIDKPVTPPLKSKAMGLYPIKDKTDAGTSNTRS